ncbi:MAG: DUF493 domain-containing protein [Proteobacteria bacterium]|nr:DUF493 domain-containing protein [Pseudomonadota bacterium]
MSTAPECLTFPTDYPVKVVGPPDDAFRARVHAIVLRHAPELLPEQVSERASSGGRFISISYLLRARSRAQVEALVTELQACEGVMMLI